MSPPRRRVKASENTTPLVAGERMRIRLNRDYWFFGWLLQRQVTKQLAIGGEIFHQTATVVFGGIDSGAATTGFNIGAIYDFDEHNHLLASAGAGLQNASATNLFSWYIGYQITGP